MDAFAGVDINGHQGFGLFDNNGAAGFQFNPVFKDIGDLVFELIFGEYRLGSGIVFDDI